MAKWIYEKWSIKWDDAGFTPSPWSDTFAGKVDIATMVASQASSMAVGDVVLYDQTAISHFNLGQDAYLRYVTSVSSGMTGTTKIKSGVGANKSWLANQRIKNAKQADVIHEEGTVPDDGIHTDGFWYVKVKKAFPELKINVDGTLRTAVSARVVIGGVLRNVTDMYEVIGGQVRKAK